MYQQLQLGTPNNNDGDSLYAGGVKISNNFAELYTALAGSSGAAIKLATGTTPVLGQVLRYSVVQDKFVGSSSDTMRTLAQAGHSAWMLTNALGVAGADGVYNRAANAAYLDINGRLILNVLTRNTSVSANTRAEIHYGLGLSNVTSLSVYTTGVVVRGFNGLQIQTASSEDTANYTNVLTTTSNGVMLHGSPTLSSNALKAVSDSSNAIAHTGYVKQNLINYPVSSTAINTNNGLVGGGSLATNRTLSIDPRYYPDYIDGLLFEADASNVLRVRPGSAVHFSYSTTGATQISTTNNLAFVSVPSTLSRSWSTGWTTTVGGPAIIDTTASLPLSTWYYLFLIGNQTTGVADFVVSANRDIASVSSQLFSVTGNANVQIVRRIGCVRTDYQTTGQLTKFSTQRVGGNVVRVNWGLNSGNPTGLGRGVDTAYTTVATSLPLYSSSLAITYANYASSTLTAVPPIQGVTARILVGHDPAATGPTPLLAMFPEAWVSSSATTNPPWRLSRGGAVGAYYLDDVALSMVPDNSVITDSQLLSAVPAAGARIRHAFFRHTNAAGILTSNVLLYSVHGFDLAR
jgi:hypothetical protein